MTKRDTSEFDVESLPGEDYPEGFLDHNSDFDKVFLKMSDEHWKKEDPEFYKMMMKHRKAHGS